MGIRKNNDHYEAPSTTLVEVKQEGIICLSEEIPATMDGTFYEEDI